MPLSVQHGFESNKYDFNMPDSVKIVKLDIIFNKIISVMSEQKDLSAKERAKFYILFTLHNFNKLIH